MNLLEFYLRNRDVIDFLSLVAGVSGFLFRIATGWLKKIELVCFSCACKTNS